MNINKCQKESFVVIGKEGSTAAGNNFIQKLWEDAKSSFNEVKHLAKQNEAGEICSIWGAMSDMTRSFKPWEDNFTKGLYLAGVECADNAQAPSGWVKWVIPGYEYIYVEQNNNNTFSEVINYMDNNNIPLVGAVHEYIFPQMNKNYIFFPIKKL